MGIFTPIELSAQWLVYSFFGLQGKIAESLSFFLYDIMKIFILLCVLIFFFAYIRTYLPREKVKKFLSKKYTIVGNFLASFIGIFTPFCTCSAIPLFIGFLESGVPLGVTFSYLIAAPMINEIAVILLFGLFGWKITLLYIGSGMVISITAGYILGKMHLEKYLVNWKIKVQKKRVHYLTFNERIQQSYQETMHIIQRVFPYVILGVGIGAGIHSYAPENLLSSLSDSFFAVPIAVLIGVPLYSNAAGIIPVITSLIEKGLPLGTALAFMMAVTALSLPEMIILRKVLKPKLLALYIGIVTLGIIITGYLFNFLL
ncbi:MAG: permease [Candidatus Woesearchaeota archaeon]|jgi:hypothetical protein